MDNKLMKQFSKKGKLYNFFVLQS